MKRVALLYCTAIDVTRFNVLKQRQQMPFTVPVGDESSRWADYSLHDAFALRLMLDLIGGEGGDGIQRVGVVPSFACGIVDNLLCRFERDPLTTMEPGLWGAVAIMEEPASPEGGALRYTDWFAGKLEDLPAWLAARSANSGAVPVRIFTVNVSRAAQFVRERAHELGLPEALSFDGPAERNQ